MLEVPASKAARLKRGKDLARNMAYDGVRGLKKIIGGGRRCAEVTENEVNRLSRIPLRLIQAGRKPNSAKKKTQSEEQRIVSRERGKFTETGVDPGPRRPAESKIKK